MHLFEIEDFFFLSNPMETTNKGHIYVCACVSNVRPLSSFCWLVRILRSSLSQANFTSTVGA